MYNMLMSFATTPNFDHLKLDPNTFKTVLAENIVFITKAFQNHLGMVSHKNSTITIFGYNSFFMKEIQSHSISVHI